MTTNGKSDEPVRLVGAEDMRYSWTMQAGDCGPVRSGPQLPALRLAALT
ncbi:hypothetical protein [Nitratireductor sp. XY-223]|nr:hypothetical protein [Nitratireductor sp. XY-223]